MSEKTDSDQRSLSSSTQSNGNNSEGNNKLHSAFFYGALMHPEVLLKIIDNDGSHIEIAPATLQSYIRHHVKNASFPAIIPYEQSARFFGTNVSEECRHVKGVVVRGLSLADMRRVVCFEGEYYRLHSVRVHPVSRFVSMKEAAGSALFVDKLRELERANSPATEHEEPMLKVLTNIWDTPVKDLSEEIWTFDKFVREKITIWL